MYYALMLIVALIKSDQVMYTQTHTINLYYVLCAYVHSGYCKIQPGYAHTDTYNKLGLCIMCLCYY